MIRKKPTPLCSGPNTCDMTTFKAYEAQQNK